MTNQPLYNSFEAEIQEVQNTLLAAADDLTSPLSDLVRAQIRRAQPPICGAVVLTVATPRVAAQTETASESDLRRKRILLAAALEMLHIALNVHRLLVNAAINEQQAGGEITLDRSFIGSTILAGDYCFSRAAQMAAQTDHPRVVETFALALQTVSEGLLRQQFQQSDGSSAPGATSQNNMLTIPSEKISDEITDGQTDAMPSSEEQRGGYDEMRQLLRSGAYAAALLVDLPKHEQQQAIALSQEVATQWTPTKQAATGVEPPFSSSTKGPLPPGWQALYQWLNHQRTNGELSHRF